jgi:hypothetical protein
MDESTRRVLEDLKEFEAAFLRAKDPGPDDAMLRQLKEILFRVSSIDSYLIEKKGKLQRNAEMWFSPRRWEKHPGGSSGLRVVVIGGIKSVINQLEFLDRNK